MKVPFGIAQIGKAFRNEITPGNFVYRLREFEQMEMQWFCQKKDADKYFEAFKKERMKWYLKLGMKKSNIKFEEVPKNELAHYARRAIDIMYKFPFGWQEIEGIHNRGDWDLSNHAKHSGQDLKYEGEFPHIIETSVGVDRIFLAFLIDAYYEVKGGRTTTTESTKEVEVMLNFSKSLAPIKVAIFPLVKNKPQLIKKTKEIYKLLKPSFSCQYDEASSIGRRYRRADEIGIPFAITVDFDSLKKNDVTVRDRNTMKQIRIKINKLIDYLNKNLNV